MSIDLQRRAETLMGQAELLSAAGRTAEAQQRYREAAECEAQVYEEIPQTRPRTRGAIAISTVLLFEKSGAVEEALDRARQYLEDPSLPNHARRQLRERLRAMGKNTDASDAGAERDVPARSHHLVGDEDARC